MLGDVLGTDDDIVIRNLENETEKTLLLREVEELPEREKLIMKMRFGLCGYKEKTQKEVADEVGISQSYISRLEKRILKHIKLKLEKLC